jgi:outer membrane protein OmpA-like peptidoglycan-associated protein
MFRFLNLFSLIFITTYGIAQNNSTIETNKKTIEELKNRITNIESVGSGTTICNAEIARLNEVVKRQTDSIGLLNKIINEGLITKYNLPQKKSDKELNNELNNSSLVNAHLSDCNCNRLFFNSSQTTTDYSLFRELDSVAVLLNSNPKLKLKLVGHADKTGTESNNMVLSKSRVDNLKNYFVKQKHVSADRIITEWHGSTIPSKDAMDNDKQFLNRRVDVYLIGIDS